MVNGLCISAAVYVLFCGEWAAALVLKIGDSKRQGQYCDRACLVQCFCEKVFLKYADLGKAQFGEGMGLLLVE